MNEITSFSASKFAELIQQGIDAWKQAGLMLVEALDTGMKAEEVAEQTAVSLDVIFQFERIGRRQIVPELLVSDFPAQKAMTLLPFSEQERLLGNATIPVCVLKDGGVETLQIPARSLSRAHVKQVFDKGRLRTIGEQRSWIEGEAAAHAEPPHRKASPYTIRGGKLKVIEPAEFTQSDLLRIMQEMVA